MASSSTPTPTPPEEHDYKWVLGFQTELRCTEQFAAHIEREFKAFIKDKIDAMDAPTHPPNPCLWKTVLVTWKGDDETTKRSVNDVRAAAASPPIPRVAVPPPMSLEDQTLAMQAIYRKMTPKERRECYKSFTIDAMGNRYPIKFPCATSSSSSSSSST